MEGEIFVQGYSDSVDCIQHGEFVDVLYAGHNDSEDGPLAVGAPQSQVLLGERGWTEEATYDGME